MALAAVVALMLVEAAAPAGAAWTAPATLSASGRNALDSQVAVDSSGDSVFVWRRFDGSNWRIQARARSASGSLGSTQDLSAPGQDAFDPQVAIDSDGDAVFVWRRFDGSNWRIQARARSATGSLSPVQNLSAAVPRAFSPEVDVDLDGDAVFVWRASVEASAGRHNWRIQARARSAAGSLGSLQTLTVGGLNAQNPQVSVNPQGKAILAWDRYIPTGTNCCVRVEARVRSATGGLGPLTTISSFSPGPNRSAYDPHVALDSEGDAVLTWSFYDGAASFRGIYRVQTRVRSVSGTLSPVQNVSPPGGDGGGGFDAQVAVDTTGNAVIAWAWMSSYAFPPEVQVRARSATGTLSPVRNLTTTAGNTYGGNPKIGVDSTGNAVITWTPEDSGVAARVRSSAGVLGPLQTLSATGSGPQVAVNGVGDAVASWQDSDGTNAVIRAAAGP